ncbi:MAG: hypothetical protein KJ882_08910 [Proteobacteria bacterium]|nr:hypothetical protein [Pseudomonadota bacterium]MBU4010874.1 hypothetical protein [Pseudomonadota bacterium]
MIKKTKLADVAVWGRIPPPIGGMAVHLRRLRPYLTEAGITIQMYSIGRVSSAHPEVKQVSNHRFAWFFSLLLGRCEPIHYVFSDNILARFAASLLAVLRGTKVVLRIGSESVSHAAVSKRFLERFMIRFAIRHVTVVVGVSEEICSLATLMGAKRVIHVPGFIPETCDEKLLPDEVRAFLEAGNNPVMLASGEVHDPDDDDLYGAYALLDLLERDSTLRLIFYAYKITLGAGPQERLAKEILKRGIQGRYFLFRSETDLLPAMLNCALMIRPTSTDGDSNSIREALHADLPVIASDCVKRPEGVITFPAGNLNAMHETVLMVLNDLEQFRQKVRSLPKPNHAKPIVNLFIEFIGCVQ